MGGSAPEFASGREGSNGCGPEDMPALIARIAADDGRHIQVPGTLNLRDAGGYPVAGGGQVAWRTLLRSDALHLLDGAGTDVLGGFGLRTILDLRTTYEADNAPTPVDDLAERGAVTFHVSMLGDDLPDLPTELGEIYDFMIDRRSAAIGDAIRSLTRPGALPGLVHCSAGKDRTGIVIAFVLAAVGVPDHFIAADYALSSLYLDARHTPIIGQIQAITGLGEELTAALMASPPELILRTLNRARRGSGSIAGYLAEHGVSRADLDELRSQLVVADPA